MANTIEVQKTEIEKQPGRWSETLDRLKADGGRRWRSLKERVDGVLDQIGRALRRPVPIEHDRPRGGGS